VIDLLHLELFYNGCESTGGTLGTFIFLFASYLSEKIIPEAILVTISWSLSQ